MDAWLATAFDAPRLADTIRAMEQTQEADERQASTAEQARLALKEADSKLARYRAALEQGTDPALIATWTAEVTATKAAAQATLRSLGHVHRMSKDEITDIITAAGNILSVLHKADGRDKADIYYQLGLNLTFDHQQKTVIAEARAPAIMYQTRCPRGVINQFPMPKLRIALNVG